MKTLAGLALLTLLSGELAWADADNGRNLFLRRCHNCHSVGPNAQSGFGPQLNDLFGRQAGSLPGYSYSEAMRSAGFAWDRKALEAFLRDPEQQVPGTKMRFWGIGDAEDLRDIADYLQTQNTTP
ncbi:c-type cytochrome [Pseudomonas oryzihabitans]|uniref:Cytochrome c n=1 Tax=Pseudomonas oryzihabitans TaxID=47885 RepID=A0AAJ2BSH1_9PSED|nr:c-type cytochrome [Pseudomonas psychrotolerans]MDR6235492.1 cytochrome c [Pseudomonas psychrotolerans]MDR6355255.1 cytochrome c [Pseudomonas psychrotolerans]